MSDEDDFTSPQDVAENMPDGIPPPPFVGLDQYFDEPSPSDDKRAEGMLGWASRASKAQRGGLCRFAEWCLKATDSERRVIMVFMSRYEGRVPLGAVQDVAAVAGCDRKTVQRAVARFVRYFPGAISETRRSIG